MRLDDLDTPAILIDLDRLERNIARMAETARSGGKRLRPHTKTHKCAEIARMQRDAGASGLTVAKLGEAEALADAGFDDLFVANEIVGAVKVERLVSLARRCAVTVGIDSLEGALPISDAAARAGIRIPVRIEVDTGHGRAGVRTVETAASLGREADTLPGLRLEGFFTHEGHVYRVPESERERACLDTAVKMRACVESLAVSGIQANLVSVGSTPSAPIMSRIPGVTELRPGNYVFLDSMQTGMGAQAEDCALTILATVISRPDLETAIVDAGTKTLSGDRAPDGSRHGIVLEDPAILFDWASEEHGHLDLRESRLKPRIGDRVRIVPWHACAVMNLHDSVYAVRGSEVVEAWPVLSRGRVQ